jgi:hypothetical protein
MSGKTFLFTSKYAAPGLAQNVVYNNGFKRHPSTYISVQFFFLAYEYISSG